MIKLKSIIVNNIFHLKEYLANPERLQALQSNFIGLDYQTFKILQISSQKDASCQTDHNELIEYEFQ